MENDKSVLSTLILIRDRINAMDWIHEKYGICQVVRHCYRLEFINSHQFSEALFYLADNLPDISLGIYRWPLEDKQSRLNWLNEHIKKLSVDCKFGLKLNSPDTLLEDGVKAFENITPIQQEFLPYKVAAMEKIPASIFQKTEVEVGRVMDDIVRNTLTVELIATIYADTIEERDLEYIFERPTFFDWLFRRERKATFKFKAQDILLNPPKDENTIRTYTIN